MDEPVRGVRYQIRIQGLLSETVPSGFDAGHVLVAALDRARREGIQSYIARLSPDELLQLETVLRSR
jgi:hypothetical protein